MIEHEDTGGSMTKIPEWLQTIIDMEKTEVNVNFSIAVEVGDDVVVIPPDVDQPVDPPVDPPETVKVIANNVGKARVNLVHDRNKNVKGFPIWTIQEPRIQYENGQIIDIYPLRIKGNGEVYAHAVAGRGAGFFVLEDDVI